MSLQTGDRLFSGVVALGAGITILLPPALLLEGKVLDLPFQDLGTVSVRFDVPAGDRFGSNLFVGRTTLDDEGAFACAARPPAESESFLLTFYRGSKPLGTVLVPVHELTSRNGAGIELRLGRIRLAFQNQEGLPIEGVVVGAAPLHATSAVTRLTEVSGPDGLVNLLLPKGPVEFCAGKAGFAPKVWEMDTRETGEAHAVPVVLSMLGEGESLMGIVISADGSPLPGAFVSVFPRSHTNVGFEARSTAFTSEDGRFCVPVPSDQQLEVVATHPNHGSAPRTELPLETREVKIRFERECELLLELEAAPREVVARSGPIECLLVDRKHEHVIRDHVWGSPTPVRSVPEGDYNAFVFWPGMDVFGATPVTALAGKTVPCRVQLLPAQWLKGRVVDSGGQPVSTASVHLDPGPWSLDPSFTWGRATSASDGTFRLLLTGKARSLRLRVRTTDGKEATWSGVTGPALVVIPGD